MMMHFEKAKLGDVTAITIASTDLEASLQYYQQLGFAEVMRADFPFPWIQISDGALLLMLRKDNNPYIALTYYVKDMDTVIADLKQAGVLVKPLPTPDKMVQRFLITTAEGHNISLVTHFDGFSQPAGKTMLTMQPQDYSNPDKYENKTCGIFGEFAFPVKDLGESISFWEKLGYKSLSKRSAPYPWAILSDGLGIVGLHQTDHFTSPTITFFASDARDKIEKLKNAGLTAYTSVSDSNMALSTPEGQQINVFKLGFS